MNDNQYICHSSEIICHTGKKGMKWGQGPYSKLKGYVKKTYDDYLNNKSKLNVTNPEHKTGTEYNDFKNTMDKMEGKYTLKDDAARLYKGLASDNKETRNAAYNAIKQDFDGRYRTNALKFQQAKKNAEKAQKDGMKRTNKEKKKKLYRVVKSKVGQIFGKPKLG